MKKLILVISVLLILMLPLFADGEGGADTSTSGKIIAEQELKPTIWEPKGTGESPATQPTFKVTFEGSEEGVLYSDIGFSKVPTQITSSGLNKTAYDNDSVTMAKGTTAQDGTVTTYTDYSSTATTYNYTSSVYVYWYCSFNKTKDLKLTVNPSDGSTVKCKYTSYTYSEAGATTTTTSDFVSADSGVILVTFADVIAVYHGNSEVIFNADVSKYPKNGVIATVTLTLEES